MSVEYAVSDKKLSWPAYGGRTFFSLSEINHQTDDGRVVSEVALLEFIHPDLQHVTAHKSRKV